MQTDQQKRLLIAIVLSTVLMIVWMEFMAPKPPPPAPASDAGAPAAALAPDAASPPAAAPAAPGEPGAAAPGTAPIPEQTVAFSSETQELTFSNQGGGLLRAVVKSAGRWPDRKFLAREKGPKGELEPVDMVRPRAGSPLPGSTSIGGELSLAESASYEMERAPDGVTFRTASGEVAVEKRYRVFPNSYELRMEVTVTNRAAAPKKATLAVHYAAWVDPKAEQSAGLLSFLSSPPEVSQGICRHAGSTEMLAGAGELKKDVFTGPVQFAGFDERYFMGVFFPRFTESTNCALFSGPTGDRGALLEADLGTLAPGQSARREFGLFIGPKSLEELQRVSAANASGAEVTPLGEAPKPGSGPAVDPELVEAIDFGWWAVICRVLLEIMKVFQKAVVNWGIAIILLTLLVKALLYPLSVKQMESMEAIRRLQPQMDALAKKYENDKEKLNLERMKLYQENKINPLGGCLPLLIQMPVWIALYRTLLGAFELYREPLLAFWITDLTAHDPFYVLPLAMGVTMFITQKMQPQMGDPTQAKVMLYFMPIFFTFLMLTLPAGLTLYIFTNNLLSIAQQKWLQRKFAAQAAPPAAGK